MRNSKRWAPIGFVFLALATMAALCGGPAATQVSPTAAPVLASPAVLSNTSTPAVAATATLLAAATATFSAVPPTNTALPSATPGSSNTPAPTADPLHTACDNPYNPLRPGAVWHYKIKSNVVTQTVTAVTGDVSQAQATLAVENSNGDVSQFQYPCDQEGTGIANVIIHYANGTLLTSSVITSTGRALPTGDKLTAGAHWSYSWVEEGTFPNKVFVNGKYGFQTAHFHNFFSRDCTVSKTETITLTVGVFPALVVDCTGKSIYTTNSETSRFPYKGQLVYALGLGEASTPFDSYHIP